MQHSNVRDVNLPTPSFASTTTIAFHSRGTFARLAGVTGPEAVDRSLRWNPRQREHARKEEKMCVRVSAIMWVWVLVRAFSFLFYFLRCPKLEIIKILEYRRSCWGTGRSPLIGPKDYALEAVGLVFSIASCTPTIIKWILLLWKDSDILYCCFTLYCECYRFHHRHRHRCTKWKRTKI